MGGETAETEQETGEDGDEDVPQRSRRTMMKALGLGAVGAGVVAMAPSAAAVSMSEDEIGARGSGPIDVVSDLDLNNNDLLNVGDIPDIDTGSGGGFESQLTKYDDDLDGVVVHRRQLEDGETLDWDRLEFTDEDGGSVDEEAYIEIVDDEGTVADSVNLNEVSTTGGEIEGPDSVAIELTNETGSPIHASIAADWGVTADD